jgi:hypothetical protein
MQKQPKEEKPKRYKLMRVYESGRKRPISQFKNLSEEEAKRACKHFPSTKTSQVHYFEI